MFGLRHPLEQGHLPCGDPLHRRQNFKDEWIDAPAFSIDGGEIDIAIVKSGTTTQQFDCDSAPITACSDGIDNDGNGLADYSDDPGCTSISDAEESSDNGDGFD